MHIDVSTTNEVRQYRAVVVFENDGGEPDSEVMEQLTGEIVKVKSGEFENVLTGVIEEIEPMSDTDCPVEPRIVDLITDMEARGTFKGTKKDARAAIRWYRWAGRLPGFNQPAGWMVTAIEERAGQSIW